MLSRDMGGLFPVSLCASMFKPLILAPLPILEEGGNPGAVFRRHYAKSPTQKKLFD